MTDPKRLSEQSSSDFELDLLRAGRLDAMPEQSANTILAGLGLAPSSAAAAAAGGGKAALLKGVFLKGGLVVAVGAVSIWGAGQWFDDASPGHFERQVQPTLPEPVAEPAPTQKAPDAKNPVAPEPAEQPPVEAQPKRAKAETSSRRATRVDTLPLELEAIDAARSALGRGDPVLTLQLLDNYASQFPKRRLQSEATLLRIEALVKRGELPAAKRLGAAFLAKHPNSPYARRVRSLTGEATGRPAPDSSRGERR